MSEGYVYILSNPSMPGLLKIGKTTRDPHQRAIELWQTGVPEPFSVMACVATPDCDALESTMHSNFAADRVSASREFFKAEFSEVNQSLEDELVAQVNDLVARFLPDHVAELSDYSVSAFSVGVIAEAARVLPIEAADAMRELRPDELMPALERLKKRRLEAAKERAKTQGEGT